MENTVFFAQRSLYQIAQSVSEKIILYNANDSKTVLNILYDGLTSTVYYDVQNVDKQSFKNVLVSVIQSYTTIKTIVSHRKKVLRFDKEFQPALVKVIKNFKKSRNYSELLPEIKMSRKVVNRLVIKKAAVL